MLIDPNTNLLVKVTKLRKSFLKAEVFDPNFIEPKLIFEGSGYKNEQDLLDALRLSGMVSDSDKKRGFKLVYEK